MVELSSLAQQVLTYVAIYYIITTALNLKAGVTGIPDFGHAMFFAVGGIVVGNIVSQIAAAMAGIGASKVIEDNTVTLSILNSEFFPNEPLISTMLILLAIALSLILGGLLGWLASFPALRLRGEYLAIMLLAASEGLRVFVTYTPQIMGATPTVGLSSPALLAWTGNPGLAATILTVGVAIGVYIYFERFYNSPSGRLFRAVRDDEESAKALGKDVAAVRRNSMILGSALAGLAGALYSMNPWIGGGSVAAQSVFDRVLWTFWPWALMILGGMASNRGVGLAAIVTGILILWPIRIYKREIVDILRVGELGFNPDGVANALEYILIGMLILVVIFMRPQGIIPAPPSRTLSSSEIREVAAKSPEPDSSESPANREKESLQ
ncbi:MAG: branched-chain amino acid ABC transporter permease [Desulfurococcales archaeon]|nr:branched-chain amino acid ABC transporter permease [Desulfurococcales archaeon]